ncbi:MAG: sel1 repeat family protein, partial [Lentisphaeria bacterium]|nr:sel1 repeat family protein [Lentisphaeria bacterium]
MLWKLLKLIGKLIGWIFSMLALPVTIIAKKPKIVLPIYTGIAICILLAVMWWNSPEQKFDRAQKALKSTDNQIQYEGLTLLKAASKKNYVPAMVMYAEVLLNGKYGENANTTGAFVLLDNAAQLGDGKAWFLKGKCLEAGKGTIRNLTEANACYQKAIGAGYAEAKQEADRTAEIAKHWNSAHKGKADAQYHLGLCYAEGNGIAADDTAARQWFTKSANGNYAPAQVKLCTWMVAGKGGPQDAILGLSYCEKAAKQNYPEAFTKLGEYYYEGKVVARNYTKAIKYLAYASKKGSASAAFKLGFCLKNGYGITQDRKKAFAYFQLAAKRNYAPGKYALGECYERGIGIPIDYTKALSAYTDSAKSKWTNADIKKSQQDAAAGQKRLAEIGKWWSLANEKNDAQAQCNVGTCYFTGNGVKKDFNKALVWFQKSAGQNNLEGIVRVADCQFHGYGIKQDAKAAVETYLKAAEKGQSYAMFRLGQCFEKGSGIEQNLTSAYNWYLKASSAKYTQAEKEAKRIKEPGTVWDEAVKKNNPEAQYRLGCCYYFADSGLPKDLKKAFEWFKKSSDQGFVKATYNLGFFYLNGWGTEKNLELMKKCFFEAAKKDHIPAVATVGELYQKGIGVEQNLTTAYRYYAKAAASQNKMAIEQLKKIKTIAGVWDPAHKGNAKAQYGLGFCYYTGNGIEKSNEKAEEWFLKSANQGYANAQYNLAVFYSLHSKADDKQKVIASW